MTRRYRHSAPWSSLDDAWSRPRLTPPLDTITLRDGRQHNYRWLPARDPILILHHDCLPPARRADGQLRRGRKGQGNAFLKWRTEQGCGAELFDPWRPQALSLQGPGIRNTMIRRQLADDIICPMCPEQQV